MLPAGILAFSLIVIATYWFQPRPEVSFATWTFQWLLVSAVLLAGVWAVPKLLSGSIWLPIADALPLIRRRISIGPSSDALSASREEDGRNRMGHILPRPGTYRRALRSVYSLIRSDNGSGVEHELGGSTRFACVAMTFLPRRGPGSAISGFAYRSAAGKASGMIQ
jgi:hypothetical protein